MRLVRLMLTTRTVTTRTVMAKKQLMMKRRYRIALNFINI